MTLSKRLAASVLIVFFITTACSGKKEGNVSGGTTTVSYASISVSPKNLFVKTGSAPQQYIAIGVYPDDTTDDITSVVSWSSSNASVAQIDAAGLVSITGAGSATITASLGGLSNSAILMVGAADTTNGGGNSAVNVLPITVNGSLCSADNYLNKPCVEVTICEPGGSPCQKIDDILLDTGSTGLRIFKQVVTLSLPQVAAGSGSLANCIHYGDGTSHWGPVRTAEVILGGEPAVEVPIQIIDAAFGPPPAGCTDPDINPADSGFNGILGIGLFTEDCGPHCATTSGNGFYFSCTATGCSGTLAGLSRQVRNPVASLPLDNNGILIQLPAIPSEGVPSVDGQLILGIGTRSNNSASGVSVYHANQFGEFTTVFYGATFTNSFIDSGSNGFFFTPPASKPIPACAPPNNAWFCPPADMNLEATTIGAGSLTGGAVLFTIGNLLDLTNSFNSVFSDIGAVAPEVFDWGLPFYFGKSVFMGIEGKSSSLGIGPFWAY